VGVIYNKRKQTKWEKASRVTKGTEMNWGKKRTTQRNRLMDVNGRLNNNKLP